MKYRTDVTVWDIIACLPIIDLYQHPDGTWHLYEWVNPYKRHRTSYSIQHEKYPHIWMCDTCHLWVNKDVHDWCQVDMNPRDTTPKNFIRTV